MGLKRIPGALAVLLGLGLIAPGSASLGAASAAGATLTVIVENLRSPNGFLRIAVWDSADSFTDSARSVAGADQPAGDGPHRFVFENLAPGRYAVAIYHDENGNGEFDRTKLGLPAEGLGFSNDARPTLLGAPSFEQAAIELSSPVTDAVIILRY